MTPKKKFRLVIEVQEDGKEEYSLHWGYESKWHLILCSQTISYADVLTIVTNMQKIEDLNTNGDNLVIDRVEYDEEDTWPTKDEDTAEEE